MSFTDSTQPKTPGLDPRRAAEVIGTDGEHEGKRGSGYLVTSQLVLTALHVLAEIDEVLVRFNADEPQQWTALASVTWSNQRLDIALLRIIENSVIPPNAMPEVENVRFGRITRPPVNCEVIGFPLFKLRTDPARDAAGPVTRYRDSYHATGTATSWSNRREGTMAIDLRAPERDPRPGRSPWEGMSGAAVFSSECLIGVIAEHHRSDGLGTVAAYRIDHWYAYLTPDQVTELAELIGLPLAPGDLVAVTSAISATQPKTVGLHQLPPTTRAFTGRGRELGQLLQLAAGTPWLPSPGMAVISAIDGMAGIGKTALAIHVAHRIAGDFPDGQLFIDLHGYTEGLRPREPGDALVAILRALGVPPQQIPADLDARASLYRDRLAGTRTLLLLDNAATEAQVRPLLPGTTGCLVLITSRKQLKGLDDAQALSLDLLPVADAISLFREVAGLDNDSADDQCVEEIASACGRLPLALRIAAALLRHRPAWPLPYLLSKLREMRPTSEGISDGERSLGAAFDLSYHCLTDDRQLLYRRLGLVPGADADRYAAAALLDASLPKAERILQDLVDHNLLVERAPGRYQLHDLIRTHARNKANDDESAADLDIAINRLLDYYQHVAQQADRQIARLTPAYVPAVHLPPHYLPAMDTREQADAWMSGELTNLITAAQYSAKRARPTHAIALPAAMHWHLRNHGPWSQALDLHADAADIALRLGDRQGRANALDNLGVMRRETGDYPGAALALDQAFDLYRELDDTRGQANVLTSLGVVRSLSGDYPSAINVLEQALDMHRVLDDQRGQASAYNNLANVRLMSGDYRGGAHTLEMALELHRSRNDLQGQAGVLNNLGAVRWRTGDYQGAIAALEKALDLHRSLGDRGAQANALGILGIVRQSVGDYIEAVEAHKQALELYRLLGNLHGQGTALGNLGHARRVTGDYANAAQAYEKALHIFREMGDHSGEAEALNGWAQTFAATGEFEQARVRHSEALRLGRAIGSPQSEAEALEGIGEICHSEGATADAIDYLRQAQEIYHRLGTPDEQRVSARLAELN
jgi:tetratricopeptide (TPR) repeat protein